MSTDTSKRNWQRDAAAEAGDIPRPMWITEGVIDTLLSGISRAPGRGKTLSPVSPYDGAVTAEIPTSTAADVVDAVNRARLAADDWRQRNFAERAEILLRFHDALVAEQDEIIDLIQWEMGKSRFSAWQEVPQVANIVRHYARAGERYLADSAVRGLVMGLTRVREVRVPKGVVGIISPWNYPLYLGVGDVVPALLAGNTVVSKADSQTALSLLWTRGRLVEAGLPADAWQVVTGPGSVIGEALIDTVDYICFTGSTATGRHVGSRAGERLIGASLELGGKNPAIVRADADLQKAAEGIVNAAFTNTGQMCIHLERVIVATEVYDAFRAVLVSATEDLTLGQTYDYSVTVGSLATAGQLAVVEEHVEHARTQGATVLVGGRRRPDLGRFVYEPTILEGVTPAMTVCGEETFGPVLSLYRAESDDVAVAMANEGSYGLSASIWSRDVTTAKAMGRRVRAGSVNINDGAGAAAGSIEAPMGGMGDSGLGRRHGAEGIRRFTEAQTLASQHLLPLGPLPGMSVERFVSFTNGQLRLLRKLGVR